MSHEPRSIKTEHDVLLTLISYIQYHYLKVSETGDANVVVQSILSNSPSASQYLHALRLCEAYSHEVLHLPRAWRPILDRS